MLYENFRDKQNECRAPVAQKLLKNGDRSRHFVTEYWENLVFGLAEQSKKLETK